MALAAILRTILRWPRDSAAAPPVPAYTFFARGRASTFHAPLRQITFTARGRRTTFYAVERD